MLIRIPLNQVEATKACRTQFNGIEHMLIKMGMLIKLVPWGTDGRLALSDLDLGSGYTAYHRASLIDLYLRTKFH